VPYELPAQGVLDHARMHALDQFTGGKFFKGAAECGFAWQRKTQIKAAQSAQFAVRLQAIHQRPGGLQVQHRLGQECTGQRAAIRLGLPHATPLCVAPITVDRQLDLGELEGPDDLFELGREARVVLLHQSDEFSLQGRKSLDGHGTQGSIHGRASSIRLRYPDLPAFQAVPASFFRFKQRLIQLVC